MTDVDLRASEVLVALDEWAAERTAAVVAQIDEHGVIRTANAPLERLAGRSLVGSDARDLVAPAQRETLSRWLHGLHTGWQERVFGFTPDARGIPRDFAVSVRRLSRGALLIAVPADSAIAEVNEQLLRLNEELARAQRQINRQNSELSGQNDRLRELDHLKDELLANVSHDLRTPLTAILGYAELMRRWGGLTDRQQGAAEIIERNARRLLRLVDDLLLLAQARAGQLQLDTGPVDLTELAHDAVELMRPLAEQGGLGLELVTAKVSPPVTGDRLRLSQLLVNLTANAVKFTPAGGQVTVRVRYESGQTGLEVQDDGPGISESEQARLFEAFERGADPGASGTGLGLAIVREVATAHRARIDLDSRPGAGTRFAVWLPS